MATIHIPISGIVSTGAASVLAITAVSAGIAGMVAELHVQPAAGNTGNIHVLDAGTGMTLEDLLPPGATGQTDRWVAASIEGANGVTPTRYAVKFDAAGDKANVYAVVR